MCAIAILVQIIITGMTLGKAGHDCNVLNLSAFSIFASFTLYTYAKGFASSKCELRQFSLQELMYEYTRCKFMINLEVSFLEEMQKWKIFLVAFIFIWFVIKFYLLG